MKLLLDTCTFLWIIKGASELSDTAKILFMNAENTVYLSAVSIWEIIIKNQLGKFNLPSPVGKFLLEQRKLHRIESLPLQEEETIHLLGLPEHHKDPFDRVLICQAIAQGLTLLTPDKNIAQYPVPTLW